MFGAAFDALQRRMGPDYVDQPSDWAGGYSRLLVTCTRVHQDSLTVGGSTQANAGRGGAPATPPISQAPGKGTMTRVAKADSASTWGVASQTIEALTQESALAAILASPRRDSATAEAYRLSRLPGAIGEAVATMFGSAGLITGSSEKKVTPRLA